MRWWSGRWSICLASIDLVSAPRQWTAPTKSFLRSFFGGILRRQLRTRLGNTPILALLLSRTLLKGLLKSLRTIESGKRSQCEEGKKICRITLIFFLYIKFIKAPSFQNKLPLSHQVEHFIFIVSDMKNIHKSSAMLRSGNTRFTFGECWKMKDNEQTCSES